ncbi:conjugal transfer protein [Salmonella enterica]|nr:conjugal transfer protein [Salmonella enterica subsp. enterica]ECG8211749.1 conjugal transfer protein [Salmonella enterica]ECO9908537.1 conjugal transfer protein [Salmonella enterica]EEA3032068.1 conjugal transfer protein [Salmonella enterica]
MKIQLLAFFVISAIVSSAQAETFGRGTQLDRRIQTATYSPDNVFRINASVGRATIVQFEDGETIRRDNGIMAMGDPSAWEVGPNKSGDAVTVKPKTDQEPDTNFIIKTNKRTYVLELKLVKDISKTTYLLRFNYPKPPAPVESPFVGRDLNQNTCSGNQNRRYEKKGDLAISPSEVWDNGTFTCMRFPTNSPRPVVYEVLPDGTETLVNSHTVNDILVIHSVSTMYKLRLNKLVLAVRTSVNNTGYYNYNGTTTGEIREVKNDRK